MLPASFVLNILYVGAIMVGRMMPFNYCFVTVCYTSVDRYHAMCDGDVA